jgi:hypothetical protein
LPSILGATETTAKKGNDMAKQQSQTDLVRMYIALIQEERKKLEDSLEAIAEYAERLRQASLDAQQRLIGRD